MSWPVLTALRGREGSRVEEALYHQALVWFFIPLMGLIAVAPFMRWRSETKGAIAKRAMNSFSLSLAVLGLALIAMKLPASQIVLDPARTVSGPFGTSLNALLVLGFLLWLCIFVASANTVRVLESLKRDKMTLGGFVSHIGIAVLLGGLILSHGLERKAQLFLREGAPTEGLGYKIAYKAMTRTDLYDRSNKVELNVQEPDGKTFVAEPALYYFDGPDEGGGKKPTPNVWPHIERRLSHDVYIALRAPITEVFAEPMSLKPGESRTQDDLTITYVRFTMKGEPGQPGTRFGAVVNVAYKGRITTAHPELEITPDGPAPVGLVGAGPDFNLGLMGISPVDRSVKVQAFFSPPDLTRSSSTRSP